MTSTLTEEKRIIATPVKRFKTITEELIFHINGILEAADPPLDLKHFKRASALIIIMNKEDALLLFARQTNQYWHHIQNKNVEFFKNSGISLISRRFQSKVSPYLDYIFGARIDKDDMEEFWELLFALIKCTLHFWHENPDKKLHVMPKTLEKLAEDWGVTLGEVFYEEESDSESSSEDDSESSSGDSEED